MSGYYLLGGEGETTHDRGINFIARFNDLSDTDDSVRKNALSLLRSIPRSQSVKYLIEALNNKACGIRQGVAYGLGEMYDTKAVEPLISILNDEYIPVRLAAIQALGKLQDTKAVKPLISMLNDKNIPVRLAAIQALGKLQDTKAVEPLISMLNDKNIPVRLAAIQALGNLHDAKAVDHLIPILNNEDVSFRLAAIQALDQLHDDKAIDPIIPMLNDKDTSIRLEVIQKLSDRGGSNTAKYLGTMLNDKDMSVRLAAVKALGSFSGEVTSIIKSQIIRKLSDMEQKIRDQAVLSLEELGEPLGRIISDTLDGNEVALQQIIETKDARYIEPLIATLIDINPFFISSKRRYAAKALGKLKNPLAVRSLISVLHDQDTVLCIDAAIALCNIQDPLALNPLIMALSHLDSYSREYKAISKGIEALKNVNHIKPSLFILFLASLSKLIDKINKSTPANYD